MNRFWKPFAELGTALKNSFGLDIFTEARFKIALLYFGTGIVIFSVVGYFVYEQTLAIIQGVIQMLQQLVVDHNATGAATNIITQTINAEIQKMNLTIGFWVVVVMIVSAYIFAGIVLFPIKRAMEKQRRFIADVAHELRTPISIMKLEAEVMLMNKQDVSREELLDLTKSTLEEADRMAKTTQFLLDFSHLESRLSKLELSWIDLGAIVTRTTKFMEPLATEKDVSLILLSVAPTLIKGNAVALEEVIANLLKNAIAYTPSGGSVTVGLWRHTYGGVTLVITDTGVGIPPEDVPNLFEPFYRGGNTKNLRSDHQSGLGLAIVKELVHLHRATISVRSTLGKGTSISVKFSPLNTKKGSDGERSSEVKTEIS